MLVLLLVLFEVWNPKFNSCFQVNGDTLFMTGNFKEFRVDSHDSGGTWDEQNAMANTAVRISLW